MHGKNLVFLASLLFGVALSGPAAAASGDSAFRACRTAVEADIEGKALNTRLSKIRRRGNNYEIWLNLLDRQGASQRGYCYVRRGKVDQLVVEEGRWSGRDPERPPSVDLG
ncbi:MAG: hypothetical protein D6727_10290 [Gammaproteobacteria bacterium]|nr:MAG: hypothetical protein D6727_10290 [Gammaproteobacteria bacterium]